jgi:beta-glucosidase
MIKWLALVLLLAIGQASIYGRYYAEAVKIAEAMSLDQRIGQTIQSDFYAITDKGVTDPAVAQSLHLGSLLVAGNGAPTSTGNMATLPNIIEEEKIKDTYLNATLQNWQALTKKFSGLYEEVTTEDKKVYRIKLLLATDAVHNDQHVLGTVLFPHNIGLSCSHNPQHFYNQGFWTSASLKKSGFNYAFSPTVAVSHNPQWGRYYETMGQEENFIYLYAKEFVRGLQNVDTASGRVNGVVASVKHFMADGATLYGANQGDARVYNFKTFISHNIQGYKGAIESEVGTVMASYSAINDIPMSLNNYYLQNLLKEDLGFGGFVISDYNQASNSINLSRCDRDYSTTHQFCQYDRGSSLWNYVLRWYRYVHDALRQGCHRKAH